MTAAGDGFGPGTGVTAFVLSTPIEVVTRHRRRRRPDRARVQRAHSLEPGARSVELRGVDPAGRARCAVVTDHGHRRRHRHRRGELALPTPPAPPDPSSAGPDVRSERDRVRRLAHCSDRYRCSCGWPVAGDCRPASTPSCNHYRASRRLLVGGVLAGGLVLVVDPGGHNRYSAARVAVAAGVVLFAIVVAGRDGLARNPASVVARLALRRRGGERRHAAGP